MFTAGNLDLGTVCVDILCTFCIKRVALQVTSVLYVGVYDEERLGNSMPANFIQVLLCQHHYARLLAANARPD